MPLPSTALRPLLLLGLLAQGACTAHAPGAPAPAPPSTPTDPGPGTFIRQDGGAPRPAWFLCDATNAPWVLVVERDATADQARLTWVNKAGGPARSEELGLGRADPGAGQVYYALSRDGREVGAVHAINPGMLAEPERAWVAPFTSVRIDSLDLQCRWLPGMRVLGVDERRSVLVTQDATGQLTYESFDFQRPTPPVDVVGAGSTNTPSQRVSSGTEEKTAGATTFTFRNGEYSDVVHVSADASLEVQHQGQSVQRTGLRAWTLALPESAGAHDK